MGHRFAAVDVAYPPGGGAVAAMVLAQDLRFSVVVAERTAVVAEVADYRPGHFVDRELPPLRALLTTATDLDLVVVDGYVHLDAQGRPGLGAHLHAEFSVPVIGVAKSAFRSATHALEVRRGQATRPLYITAAGVDVVRAADIVREMAGRFRMPDALRRVDALSRSAP